MRANSNRPARVLARAVLLLALCLAASTLLPFPPAARDVARADPYHHTFHLQRPSNLPAAYEQADCLECHQNVYDIQSAAPVLGQGRKLFTTIGCVDCHRMDSVSDYEKRKVGADLRHIDAKLSRSFVQAWIADPQAFRPSTAMPRIFKTIDDQTRREAAAITEYLFQNSTAPPGAAAIPANARGNYENGRLLFQGHGMEDSDATSAKLPPALKAGLGCLACHTNINDWKSDELTSRGNGDRQPWIVVDLMRRQNLAQLAAERQYAAMSYDDRQFYALRNMDNPRYIHFGPDLSAIGQKLLTANDAPRARQWLFAWLKNPRHYSGYTLMPNLRLTDQEALDLSTYLLAQTRGKIDHDLREDIESFLRDPAAAHAAPAAAATQEQRDILAALDAKKPDEWHAPAASSDFHADQIAWGARLITHYGCLNCHEIGGAAAQPQTALDLSRWGSKPLAKFDFSRLKSPQQTRQDWLMLHLTDSDVPALNESIDRPRMPIFRLAPQEATALTTFVLGNREFSGDAALRDRAMNPTAMAIAKGRALTELHNCVACHQTEVNAPAIQQYFKATWISAYAPPQLRGEGNKVQYDWLRDFLTNVRKVRPLPLVRMPSFTFTTGPNNDEIAGIIDYFHAASINESDHLRKWLGEDDRNQLIAWALLRGQAVPIDLNQKYSTPAQIQAAYQDIRYKASFAANLYDCRDPSPRSAPALSDADFARGERFLQTLQCLDCHVMSADGNLIDPAHAKAPNLDLAYQRLQRRWVRAWVQDPDVIVHGSNMPPYFSGLATRDIHGQPLAASEKLAPGKSALLTSFGETVTAQTQLLLDFLYAAGARNYQTTIKPRENAFLNSSMPTLR